MLRRLGIQVKEFVRNRPGSKWLTLFLKRHPEVALRTPQALGNSRANVSEQEIRDWFRVTKEYLVGKNLMWIFAHPERVREFFFIFIFFLK